MAAKSRLLSASRVKGRFIVSSPCKRFHRRSRATAAFHSLRFRGDSWNYRRDCRGASPKYGIVFDMARRRQEWHGSDVARRAWTRAERRVVLRGFFGRLIIAIEPLIASVF
ncbi:MAG TPA: hypothetical protein VMA36_20330, partial [Candidatus Limnocylindria bacterium]|nr:hypothetical protein [Candidatus Limnocylindria bacterium]